MIPKAPKVLAIWLFLGALAHPPAATERVERQLAIMGTRLTVVVEATRREAALAASDRAIEAVRAAERRLSTWDPNSEMSRFNRSPAGQPSQVSRLLERDLRDALECGIETGGTFTPGLGQLVLAWRLRTGGRLPDDAEIDNVVPALNPTNLLVANGMATRLDERFVIEEGAFGKGIALDDALAALDASTASAALLNLGGQVAILGATNRMVDIADPRARGRSVLRLEVSHGSVATTGNSERGIVVAGTRMGHVLDPTTGRPAGDFGSLTVWANRAVRADCLSTGLYVMGPDGALAWAREHPDVGVVVLEVRREGLVARASTNLREHLRAATNDIELRFLERMKTTHTADTNCAGERR